MHQNVEFEEKPFNKRFTIQLSFSPPLSAIFSSSVKSPFSCNGNISHKIYIYLAKVAEVHVYYIEFLQMRFKGKNLYLERSSRIFVYKY